MRDSSPRLKSKRAELLFQARARDARLAGNVEQLVEQVRVDARHFLALPGDRLAARRHRLRRRQSLLVLGAGPRKG